MANKPPAEMQTEEESRIFSPVCVVEQVLETRVSTPTLKLPRESYILRRRAMSQESSNSQEKLLTDTIDTKGNIPNSSELDHDLQNHLKGDIIS